MFHLRHLFCANEYLIYWYCIRFESNIEFPFTIPVYTYLSISEEILLKNIKLLEIKAYQDQTNARAMLFKTKNIKF